jgi:SMODS and SLOG-associating 2TM effector domain 1/SMODS and SLOG-associating 2TM effector domain 3
MTSAEYPALFEASDRASRTAQRTFLRLLRVYLILLVVASLTAIMATEFCAAHLSLWLSAVTTLTPTTTSRLLAIASPLSIAIGLVLMIVIRVQRYEKIWFDCRAVAESVKTATWRYMVQAPPYHTDDSAANVDTEFLKELVEIRKARPGVDVHLIGPDAHTAEISSGMRRIRALPLQERKKIYLEDRLLDQQIWYERNTGRNRASAARWFWSVIVVQVLALAFATAMASSHLTDRPWPINPVAIFMTLAGACLAWSQTKRHEELTQSYALAAHELRALRAFEAYVVDAESFQGFVSQVEDAISREHTMWRVRRNVALEAKKP